MIVPLIDKEKEKQFGRLQEKFGSCAIETEYNSHAVFRKINLQLQSALLPTDREPSRTSHWNREKRRCQQDSSAPNSKRCESLRRRNG